MRFLINGKKYRLKESIISRLYGMALLFLGYLCHKLGIDTAGLFMCLYGVILLFKRD